MKNSYMNDKTCGNTANNKKIKISHILETSPISATEKKLKWVCTEKYKYQKCICHWTDCKNIYINPMNVLENTTGDNVTSLIIIQAEFIFHFLFFSVNLVLQNYQN